MSIKEDINKEALWLVYGKKCAYSGLELDLNEVTKDHIIPKSAFIPEKLKSNPAKIKQLQAELRAKYGLPTDFNFNNVANILPCSEHHNRNMKKGIVFTEDNIRYFTNIAYSKVKEYHKMVEELNGRDKMADLVKLLKEFDGDVEQILSIDRGVFDLDFTIFFAGEETTTIAKEQIDDLLNKPIFEDGVELVRKDHSLHERSKINISDSGVPYIGRHPFAKPENRVVVKSCNEYMRAAKAGYYADNNLGLKFSCRLESQYNILNALKRAKPVVDSHIKDYGVFSLYNIPSSFFPVVGEEDYSQYSSYADAINEGAFKLDSISKKALAISHEGMNHYFTEIFRADFNDDGKEEILVYSHASIDNASFSYGDSHFITIDETTGMFKQIDIDWE